MKHNIKVGDTISHMGTIYDILYGYNSQSVIIKKIGSSDSGTAWSVSEVNRKLDERIWKLEGKGSGKDLYKID